jgi:eukaryotic-like serine/threonine-protein kinase
MSDLPDDLPSSQVEVALEAFCDAWVSGEDPDPNQFCEAYPEIKSQLREKIDAFIYAAQGLEAVRKENSPEDVPTGLKPGDSLGEFQIVRQIGLGGMGVVYEAVQTNLGRSIALKLLSPHCALRPESIERFKREAATASKLDHAGIVRIHGFGTERGLLYYTMELVEGAPLDKVLSSLNAYPPNQLDGDKLAAAVVENSIRRSGDIQFGSDCSEKGPTPPTDRPSLSNESPFCQQTFTGAACRLILQVATALDHAHENGVIHRDVKPSNILIQRNGSAVLTDFGIARAQGLPTITMTGELAGTPCYVSPEQVTSKGGSVDRRADVYSLGVTLFEFLTLKRPFDGSTSREVLDKIVSKNPPPLRRLNPKISRDLETICLAAIEKNPCRRYQTAAELASDLQCFLEYRPITARPLGPVTRTIRLLRRKPAQSLAVGLLLLLVIGGPLIYGIQQSIANRAINAALAEKEIALREAEAQKVRANAEALRAKRKAETASLASNLLQNLFLEPFSQPSKNGPEFLAQFFQRAADSIHEKLADDPLIQAELLHTVGVAYTNLDLFSEAESILKEAFEIRQGQLGHYNADTIHTQLQLARLYHNQGRFLEEEPLLHSALDSIHERPEENRKNFILALNGLGTLCLQQSKHEDARTYLESGLNMAMKEWGEDHRISLELRHKLGRLCLEEKQFDQAESTLKAVLEGRERLLGSDDPETINALQSLAMFYFQRSAFDPAKTLFSRLAEILRRIRPPDDMGLLETDANLACVFWSAGELEEAERRFRDVLHREQSNPNATKEGVSTTMTHLGIVLKGLEKTEEAASLLNKAFGNFCGLADSQTGFNLKPLSKCLKALSEIHLSQDRFSDAAALYEKAFQVPGFSAAKRLVFVNNAAICFYHGGNLDKAEVLIRECLDKTPSDDPERPHREKLLSEILEQK